MKIFKFRIFEDISLEDAKEALLNRLMSLEDAEALYNWKYYEAMSDYLLIKNDMNVNRATDQMKNVWKHYGKRLYSGQEAKDRYLRIDDLIDAGEIKQDEAGVFQGSSGKFAGYNVIDGEIFIESFHDERIAALYAVLLIEASDLRGTTEEKFAEHYFSQD